MKKNTKKITLILLATSTIIPTLFALYHTNTVSPTSNEQTPVSCELVEGTRVCDYTALFQD